MNVVPADLRRQRDACVVDHSGFTVSVPGGDDPVAALDQPVEFGVRPEDVSLAANLTPDAETFEATVSVREPLGELLLLHCQVGEDELQVKVEPRSDIYPGDTVALGFDEQRFHLFDATSGTALYHSAASPETPAKPTPDST